MDTKDNVQIGSNCTFEYRRLHFEGFQQCEITVKRNYNDYKNIMVMYNFQTDL